MIKSQNHRFGIQRKSSLHFYLTIFAKMLSYHYLKRESCNVLMIISQLARIQFYESQLSKNDIYKAMR